MHSDTSRALERLKKVVAASKPCRWWETIINKLEACFAGIPERMSKKQLQYGLAEIIKEYISACLDPNCMQYIDGSSRSIAFVNIMFFIFENIEDELKKPDTFDTLELHLNMKELQNLYYYALDLYDNKPPQDEMLYAQGCARLIYEKIDTLKRIDSKKLDEFFFPFLEGWIAFAKVKKDHPLQNHLAFLQSYMHSLGIIQDKINYRYDIDFSVLENETLKERMESMTTVAITRGADDLLCDLCDLYNFDFDANLLEFMNPVHLAVNQGQIKCLHVLLEKGPHKLYDGDKNTPLHYAAEVNAIDCLRLINDVNCRDDLGLDVNARNKDGNTALHLAAENNSIECCEFLRREMGANVNARNEKDKTPLEVAHFCDSYGCFEFL